MSASLERANSTFRYVKTNFPSTMSEDTFNALLLLYVHSDIKLDYKKVIDMYVCVIQEEWFLKTH